MASSQRQGLSSDAHFDVLALASYTPGMHQHAACTRTWAQPARALQANMHTGVEPFCPALYPRYTLIRNPPASALVPRRGRRPLASGGRPRAGGGRARPEPYGRLPGGRAAYSRATTADAGLAGGRAGALRARHGCGRRPQRLTAPLGPAPPAGVFCSMCARSPRLACKQCRRPRRSAAERRARCGGPPAAREAPACAANAPDRG